MSSRSSVATLLCVSCLLLLQPLTTQANKNDSPVVGILSQPYHYKNTTNYWIPASYVKWLESAGARSIPIPYHATTDQVKKLFHQVNGMLFPGGGSPVPQSAKMLWKMALQANRNGDFFPIWGTCLGFEYLIQLAPPNDDGTVLLKDGFDAENISLPLILWSSANPSMNSTNNSTGGAVARGLRGHNDTVKSTTTSTSLLYDNDHVQQVVSKQPVTMNNHHMGVEPEDFLSNKELTSLFHITSVNRDRQGRPFVSSMESKHVNQYPYFGVQYHPEKNPFEYGTTFGDVPYEDINHSSDAVEFSFYLARFFVNLTRCNQQRARHHYNLTEKYPLVYTYPILHTNGIPFEYVYVIPTN